MDKPTDDAKKILIVDDDRQVRDLMSTLLKAVNYEPLEASTAIRAIDVLEKQDVDLMLLDIHMVGAGGMDLIHALQRRRLMLPIIVVSGFVSKVIAKQLLELGVKRILAKPFDRVRLIEEIRVVLEPELLAASA